ncbi:MAG: amidohydrolase [Chloroflexi bacterium]|nr:amidohydrolase [Chloroflexota bacterium]
MTLENPEIVDVHAHIWKSIDLERAAVRAAGRRDRDCFGTPDTMVAKMDAVGICSTAFHVVFPVEAMRALRMANLPEGLTAGQRQEEESRIDGEIAQRAHRNNEWACGVGREQPRLIPFIGLSKIFAPRAMLEEVEQAVKLGAKGVKLHPGEHCTYVNDRAFWPLFERCQELGIPILAHSSMYPTDPPGVSYSQPLLWAEVIENFPRLTVILAHLGGAYWDERLEMARRYPQSYFDTSLGFNAPDRFLPQSAHRYLAEEDAVRVIRKIGVDRVLFGTDGPFHDPLLQIEQLLRLDLTDDEKERIFATNAKQLLGL